MIKIIIMLVLHHTIQQWVILVLEIKYLFKLFSNDDRY